VSFSSRTAYISKLLQIRLLRHRYIDRPHRFILLAAIQILGWEGVLTGTIIVVRAGLFESDDMVKRP
jgi:hypothetical protein